ncbi:cytochrome b561 [Mariprofundus ferrinatatus]|uniref:Cytochrome b561 n=1 Tax=Mariprofundus ferrinatatus TaxID=1921087 RepID=A0A2K8LBM5_9PROT|nr:cytochrome b/b6 domain-containing protein [Mariprofundus ferrinatatus]ATX81646.1 cytochrome b561 [Mariprofundus ferrinatatus]
MDRIDKATRVFHYLFIATVAFQLGSALIMRVPEPGKMVIFENVLFSLHIMLVGWTAYLISFIYAMTRFAQKDAWGRLVPWFSKKYRAEFFKSAKEELPGIFTGKLAPPENRTALAGAMHGLGFLTLIALGSTGAYVMNGVRSDGTMTDDMMFMFELHEFFGVVIYVFIACHVSMVVYHLILGHKRVLDIFERIKIRWK